MIGRALIGVLIALLAWPSHGQSVRAWLDRSTVFLGETVTLRLEVSNDLAGVEPDLSALAGDFQVLSTGSSTQMSFVNGRQTVSAQWVIQLEPLSTGTLQVPPIKIGDQTTSSLPLAVMEAPASSDDSGIPDLLVTLEVDPVSPYVQQQVRLVVKLYHALPITEGSLTEPEVENGLLQRLGEDVTYAAERGGRRYQVVERRYAMFPEHSGPLTIDSVQFRGRVSDRNSGQRLSFFNPGRSVQAASEPVQLTVRPRPDAWPGGPWLPARSIALEENWGTEQLSFTAGEPVTRTLQVDAQGLPQTLLPVLGLDAVEGMRIYPDQPETRERTDGQWVYATRSQKLAIVPENAGELTLPEIRVPWWNVVTDTLEFAVIPARTLTISPGALTPSQPPVTSADVAQSAAEAPTASPDRTTPSNRLWPIWAGVSTALWLVTLIAWWRSRSKAASAPTAPAPADAPSTRHLRHQVLSAINGEPLSVVARRICQWAQAERPGTGVNLRRLSLQLQQPAADLLKRLDRCLYQAEGVADDAFDRGALKEAFKHGLPWREPTGAQAGQSDLPELFPLSS